MSRFVQLHYLTIYPPSNPNRDDLGRPKTATYGGAARLRLSSQSLKRAVRTHPEFRAALDGQLGERTQRLGEVVLAHLAQSGADAETARQIAMQITDIFGKIDAEAAKKDPDKIRTRQLAFISPEERRLALQLADDMAAGGGAPGDKDLKKLVLRAADGAADIAMFGRMLADDPDFNRDAAVQVAHAITTHRVAVEEDFYTAVDDLKTPAEDAGAGFIGEAGFGSGVYYLYVCINRTLLTSSLDGDAALARRSCEALSRAFAIASPGGKRTSYAHNARAGYIFAERGDQQPRSLASAFFKPVAGADLMGGSINALETACQGFDDAYGPGADATMRMNVMAGEGTLAQVTSFAGEGLSDA